jgi:hypothetical protein
MDTTIMFITPRYPLQQSVHLKLVLHHSLLHLKVLFKSLTTPTLTHTITALPRRLHQQLSNLGIRESILMVPLTRTTLHMAMGPDPNRPRNCLEQI